MNFEHIKLFVRVAYTQNISAAGQTLGLSAAVASAHINKLEADLGVRLLYRTTRKVSLTSEGEVFLPHAEDLLASVDSAKASIGVGSATIQGTLRVTSSASFGRMHLVPLLPTLMAQYPLLNIDLRLSDTIVDMVEGGFDVAIRNAALKDSSLIARKLSDDERLVCATPAYLAEFGVPLTPQDLQQHRCIILGELNEWVFNTETGQEVIRVKGALKVDNGEALRDACALGLGVTINSRWSVYEHLQRGELVQVLADFPLASNTAVWAVYPSSRLLAPKVRAFIDFLLAEYAVPAWLSTVE